ncbi:protein ROS1A isoform X3 [Elaeis guineensis]|uniref:Protein ROS1C isoform X3 n=1 Tax=Elaeis guineensis var. tenera TaxID=51953 RepID=A0A8N4EYU5_ELAGV|nr:protein ROS1C isoform X3 [Elaeis guineensis]
MDTSGEAQLKQQQDLEKKGPWVLATAVPENKTAISDNNQGIPAGNSNSLEPSSASATGDRSLSSSSRGIVDHIPELNSSKGATTSSTTPVHLFNASLHTTTMDHRTAGFLHIPFRNIMVFGNADVKNMSSSSLLDFTQIGTNKNLSCLPNQFLVNGKVLMISSVSNKDGLCVPFLPNLNSLTKEAACTSMKEEAYLPVAPLTPAKGKEIHEENANNGSLKLLASVTPDKVKTVEDCIPPELINLVGEELTDGVKNQELDDQCSNCNRLVPTTVIERASSPKGVKQHVQTSLAAQQLESGKDEQRNYPGISLNSTPRQKTRRKRYMPKVIQEGKPTKTPQPATPNPLTPMPVRKNGNHSKSREKKSLNSLDTSTNIARETVGRSNAEGTSADPHVINGTKPVRQRLKFESEGGPVNECLESTINNAQSRGRGRPRRTPATSRSKSKLQLSQEIEVVVENSSAGLVFDLTRSLNQMLEEYITLPEIPTPPAQSFKRESLKETSKNFAGNRNSIKKSICGQQAKMQTCQKRVNPIGKADFILVKDDNNKAGMKRDYSHIDSAQTGCALSKDAHFMQGSEEINQASRSDQTSSHGSYSQERQKRMRTEKQDLQYHQFMQCYSTEFASADAQKLLTSDKLQSPDCMLTFNHIRRPTKKRSKIPVRACKLSSIASITGCNHLLPTPEMPPEACSRTFFAAKCKRMKRKRHPRNGQALLVKIMPLDVDHEHKLGPCIYSSLERKSVGSTASGGDFPEKDLHHCQIIPLQDYPIRNSVQELPFINPVSQAIIPYVNDMNDVIWKIQQLDLQEGQVHSATEPQNALVPFGGNMMVPYDGPFDIIKKQRPRAKVELDGETNRVWKILMGKTCSDEAEGLDVDKEKWWEEERRVFRGRADSFIARMRLVQGDRRFSLWKGSVVDSVIGVFLTQNVSDHLSSSAFMALAARFSLQSRCNGADLNAEKMSKSTEKQDGSSVPSDATNWQEKGFSPDAYHQGPLEIHDADYVKENETANSNESMGTNSRGNIVDDSKGIGVHIHGSEPKKGFETPHYRIDTLISGTGSTESEDRQFFEDVVSSQNFVASSGNSLDYLIQTVDPVGSNSGSNSEANIITGSMSSGLDSSVSFEENVNIAGNTQNQEMDNRGNDRVLLEKNCGGYDKESCEEGENGTKITHGLNNLEGACRSIRYAPNFHLECSEHNIRGVPSVPAARRSDNSLNFMLVGMENINVVREESISNLPFTASGTMKTNKIKKIDRHSSLSSENATNSAGERSALLSKITEALDSCACINGNSLQSPTCSRVNHIRTNFQQEERKANFPMQNTQHAVAEIPHIQEHQTCLNSCNIEKKTLEVAETVDFNSKDEVCSPQKVSKEGAKSTSRAKKAKVDTEKVETFDWDSLRRQAYCNGYQKERSSERMDSLDWEAVRCADVNEISEAIRERGMNNVLAGRIKDFLNRLVKEHGSIDLEWLRDIPPDKAKDYLLSIQGLGLKSVECVRLLTLHHLAFPVDTNVGRICVRLGWVPLQPLPESLQLHLLELYPIMATIQKFLWPRLCKLDQETLYELHYQMITFGKVFCTKSKPNCNACPMRGECKHFASAFASARFTLPGPEEKSIASSTIPPPSAYDHIQNSNPALLAQPEESKFSQGITGNNCEPIIEEPASPEPARMENFERDIEEAFYEDPDEIPTIKLNLDEFTQNLQNYIQENIIDLQEDDMAKAIVAITKEAASIPMPKLKNVSRLRTEHQVYDIPDSHPLLEGLDRRQSDDPCPYLLTIWTPGETAKSTEPPETCCNSQDTGELCDNKTCFACSCRREEQAQIVRGTILIPCRTAMRGSFPLNGTYFQVNEVFADHQTSYSPIHVPRKWIWNLPRRTVYFGTSVPSIFKGLTTEETQQCFWRGYICVRGFERETRAPKPLCARLHFPASKAPKNKKTPFKEAKK